MKSSKNTSNRIVVVDLCLAAKQIARGSYHRPMLQLNPLMKQIIQMAHISQLLLVAASVLTMGYWRASAVSAGVLFMLNLRWWLRFLLSTFFPLGILTMLNWCLDCAWRRIWQGQQSRSMMLMETELFDPKFELDHPNICVAVCIMLLLAILWTVALSPLTDEAYAKAYLFLAGGYLLVFVLELSMIALYQYRLHRRQRWL